MADLNIDVSRLKEELSGVVTSRQKALSEVKEIEEQIERLQAGLKDKIHQVSAMNGAIKVFNHLLSGALSKDEDGKTDTD